MEMENISFEKGRKASIQVNSKVGVTFELNKINFMKLNLKHNKSKTNIINKGLSSQPNI